MRLLLLEGFDFVAEALVGAGEGGVGIDAVVVGPVDEVEEERAKRLFCGFGLRHSMFRRHFWRRRRTIGRGQRGVDPDAGGFLLQADGLDQGRQAGGDTFEDGLASFVHLDLFPALAVVAVGMEDEGVAVDEFVADGVEYVGRGESPFLFGYFGVEEEVHEEVAEFLH